MMMGMHGTGYDPYAHAERLGIQVVHRTLRTAHGLWVPEIRTVFMHNRLRRAHDRSVLTHELGHICMGHRESTPRHELQADRWAARKLIHPDELARVAQYSPDANVWCHELGVTADILERYFLDRPAA